LERGRDADCVSEKTDFGVVAVVTELAEEDPVIRRLEMTLYYFGIGQWLYHAA
jgi:hypothetical protein